MKKYLILAFLLISISSFSQNFTFNRAFINGSFFKMKGEVDITDSTMSITTNGIPSLSKIVLITKRENNKQFKVVAEDQTDLDIRITFSPNPNIQKKEETFILLTEAKDNFTKQFMNVMYYLIPKAE
jgi:hypothetical protein